MKLLLTGGTGFVGRNVMEYFSAKGHQLYAPDELALDLTSAEGVSEYLQDVQPDVVIHSATTLRNKTDYPDKVAELNLRMFFNILRAAPEGAKIINLGSGSEYCREHWHDGMREDFFDKHVPSDSHSLSKYIISKYIESVSGLRAVTLRIFGIYGRYEDYRFKFISNTIAKNILGLPIIINQNVVYDYIDVMDFCGILEWFVENEPKFKSYNVTFDQSIDLVEIANIVNRIGRNKTDIVVLNDGVGAYYTGDNSRLKSEVPGPFSVGFYKSIGRLYEYMYENRTMLNADALKADEYLEYAKKLRSEYFFVK